MLRADGIQVGAVQEAVLGRLGIVELEPLHPLARGRDVQPLAQFILDGRDGRLSAVRRP